MGVHSIFVDKGNRNVEESVDKTLKDEENASLNSYEYKKNILIKLKFMPKK